MLKGIEIVNPQEIEKRSFEIISGILGDRKFNKLHEPIIKRVIHTTADFEFADILKISDNAVKSAVNAVKGGFNIVTDTNMAASGINKRELSKYGGSVICLIDNKEISEKAKSLNVTRASLCMDEASKDIKNGIFVIGNAPTALIRLCELIEEKKVSPYLVVGVPVGFVNVVESKELLKDMGVPYIISEGRKGGSNIAAAIINAILYNIEN